MGGRITETVTVAKRYPFEVWRDAEQLIVVEHDPKGPVMRAGPFYSVPLALSEMNRLALVRNRPVDRHLAGIRLFY